MLGSPVGGGGGGGASSSASSVNSFRSAREEHSPNSADGATAAGTSTSSSVAPPPAPVGGAGSPMTTGTRARLPVPKSEVNNANFWSFLKQCIGRELSKITMPVQWNEPISFLQRLSEYMNYAYLLDVAASKQDAADRLKYVACFAVSALAANVDRMGKPFNPLLGETYELKGHGFRIISEQVGHHPPVSAFHAASDEGNFVFRGSLYPKLKFWGKSIEFQPKGAMTVELPAWGETYSWSNVNCVIHNIIVGSLWMEHQGTMEVRNHVTGHRAVISFKPGGWFSGKDDLHVVEGFIVDGDGEKVSFLYGRWTEFLCAARVDGLEALFDHAIRLDKLEPSGAGLPKHEPFILGAVPNSKILWQADPRSEDAAAYYHFSPFTMGLNELMPGMETSLCRTDSRLRPDIRALEDGDLDKASGEKDRLENKQREFRKPFKNKKESDWWTPRWFEPASSSSQDDWRFKGGYWDRKFDNVPDIF